MKKRFLGDIVTADSVIYAAHRNKCESFSITIVTSFKIILVLDFCNGKDLPVFDAQAMCDGIRKPRTKATETKPAVHWSAKRVADSLGFHMVEKDEIKTLLNKPFVIYDKNGIPLVFNLPGFFGPEVTQVS
jgi:hypothetical protein